MYWLKKLADDIDDLFNKSVQWYEREGRPEFDQEKMPVHGDQGSPPEEFQPSDQLPHPSDIDEARGQEVHRAMDLIERWRQKKDECQDLEQAIRYAHQNFHSLSPDTPDYGEKVNQLSALLAKTERERDDLRVSMLNLNDQIRMIAEDELGPYGYDEVSGQSRAMTYLDQFMGWE